jgi:hypothetical protein
MSHHALVGDTLRAVGCTRVKPLQAALLFTQRTARSKPPCF